MKLTLLITTIALLIVISGCGKKGSNTSTGNPLVSVEMASFSASSTKLGAFSVSSLTLCFKRLRFKPVDEIASDIDLTLGQITLAPSGTQIATVQVPPGEYERVEFDLEKDCLNGGEPSVVIDNDNDGGTPFQTDDRMTIKFEGAVTITSDQTLTLFVDNLITAADGITDANEIKSALEDSAATGSY